MDVVQLFRTRRTVWNTDKMTQKTFREIRRESIDVVPSTYVDTVTSLCSKCVTAGSILADIDVAFWATQQRQSRLPSMEKKTQAHYGVRGLRLKKTFLDVTSV